MQRPSRYNMYVCLQIGCQNGRAIHPTGDRGAAGDLGFFSVFVPGGRVGRGARRHPDRATDRNSRAFRISTRKKNFWKITRVVLTSGDTLVPLCSGRQRIGRRNRAQRCSRSDAMYTKGKACWYTNTMCVCSSH